MTRLRFLTVCLAILLSYVQTSVAVIRPSSTIYVKDRFYAYLDKPGEVNACWFTITNSRQQRLYLNSTTPITLANGFTILPFSTTVCGVRGNVSASYYDTTLKLDAEFVNGDRDTGSTYIRNFATPQSIVTTITADIGKINLKCKLSTSYTSCRIVADTGEYWDQCEVKTTIRSNRNFNCYVYRWGDSVSSREQIIVKLKQQPVVTTSSMVETATSIILRCQFHTGPLKSCRAELPDHKSELYIKDGLMNGSYSSYDTNVATSKCAVEITKPLKESDIGLWRIVNHESEPPAGCLFYVGDDEEKIIERELKLVENKMMNVYYGDRDLPEITFVLPFEIEKCFLKIQDYTTYLNSTKDGSFGRCRFSGVMVRNGTWQFGATGKNYDTVVLRDVYINVQDKMGSVITPNVKAEVGKSAQLMCRSSFDDPISFCAFIKKERLYLLDTTNNTQKFGDVEYIGRGLEYGDCGIRINNVQKADFGYWVCQFLVIGNDNYGSMVINVMSD